jgi:hypothetical protein
VDEMKPVPLKTWQALGAGYPFPSDCARFERPWCPMCERMAQFHSTVCHREDRYGWPLTVLQCDRCGLIYSRECWTHDGARQFYARHYRPLVNAYHGKPDGYSWWEESAMHYVAVEDAFARDAGLALPRKLDPPYVLDVGGMGRGTGPEADGALWETAVISKPAAFLICAQTFDHLIDPRLAWDKFAQATAAGGHLYVDVVDPHAVLQRGHMPWKADHTLYVTPRVLRAMADPAIWDTVGAGYMPDGVHYFGLWRRK